jgi:hypothetical protein
VIGTLARLVRRAPEQQVGQRGRLGGAAGAAAVRRRVNRFERELARQAAERQAALLEPSGIPPHTTAEAAFYGVGGTDGFLPLRDAAREQGVDERALRRLIARGLIEARERDGVLVARPAIVSVLAVKDERR